jgi:hypothetical protein
VGKTWNAYRILIIKTLQNYLLGRLRTAKDNIQRLALREVVMAGAEQISPRIMTNGRLYVLIVLNLWVL